MTRFKSLSQTNRLGRVREDVAPSPSPAPAAVPALPRQLNGVRPRRVEKSRIASQAISAMRQPESRAVDTISELMDDDYQVALVRRAIEAHVQSIPVTFSVEGGDARADALAASFEELWEEVFPETLEGIAKGRTAFEKVFCYEPSDNLTTIRKLDKLPFKLSTMKLDKDGHYEGVVLKGHGEPVTIPADQSWWCAIYPTPTQPHGTGLYAGAPYKTWKTRQEAIRLRDVHIRRFVLEWILVRCRENERDTETGEVLDNTTRMLDAVDTMRAGGAIALSTERMDGSSEGEFAETIETVGGDRKDAGHLDTIIDGMDVEQVRAFGIAESVITDGTGVGSYAKLKQQAGLLFAVCLGVLRQVASSFQRYVIDKVVALNWEPHEAPCIRIVYPKMTEQQEEWIVEVAKGLLSQPALSPLILSGAVDLRQLLEGVGVPLTGDAVERLERFIVEQRQAMQAQAVAGGGDPAEFANEPLPGGQYSGIGRRQWQNNVKAIGDVLDQLAAGLLTETRAKVLLRSLDVPDGQIAELLTDAADGVGHALSLHILRDYKRDRSGKFDEVGGGGGGGSKKKKSGDDGGHDTESSDKPKTRSKPKPLKPKTKSEIAKSSAKRVDKEIQRYAEEGNEAAVAKTLGGEPGRNSQPYDVVIESGGTRHGVELKTMVTGENDKLTMNTYAQVRKINAEAESGATTHTIVVDDRKVFNANGPGKHDPSKRKYYYRRGVAGSARIGSMHEVKDPKELRKLIDTPDDKLPPAAKRTDDKLRKGKWVPFKDGTGKGFKNKKTGQVVRAKK